MKNYFRRKSNTHSTTSQIFLFHTRHQKNQKKIKISGRGTPPPCPVYRGGGSSPWIAIPGRTKQEKRTDKTTESHIFTEMPQKRWNSPKQILSMTIHKILCFNYFCNPSRNIVYIWYLYLVLFYKALKTLINVLLINNIIFAQYCLYCYSYTVVVVYMSVCQ